MNRRKLYLAASLVTEEEDGLDSQGCEISPQSLLL